MSLITRPRFSIRAILKWSYGIGALFVLVMYVAFIMFSRDVLEDTVRENSKFYSYLFEDVLDMQLNRDIELLERAAREKALQDAVQRGSWDEVVGLIRRYLGEKDLVLVRICGPDNQVRSVFFKKGMRGILIPSGRRCSIFAHKGHIFAAIKVSLKGRGRSYGYLEAVYNFPPSSLVEKFSIPHDLAVVFVLKGKGVEYSKWLGNAVSHVLGFNGGKLSLRSSQKDLESFFRFEFPLNIKGQPLRIIILKNSSLIKKDFYKFTRLLTLGFLLLIMVMAFVAMIIQRTVIRPVFKLSALSRAISSGKEVKWTEYDTLLSSSEELNRLYSSYKNMVHSLLRAKAEAERANKLKDLFLSSVNHELRTPLTTIIGMIELLQKSQDESKKQQYLRILKDSSQNLLVIVNAILDFSKITSDELEIKWVEVNLREFLEDIAEVYRISARSKNVNFMVSLDEELPHLVKTDPVRLRQVLYNLLNNAFKFTPSGEVELLVKVKERVKDEKGKESCRILFKVRDTGVGIPRDKQAKIFRPFVQVEGDISRKFGGIGLGLSISQRIITLMGGRIEVKSCEGKGSEFFFELKLPVVPSLPSLRQEETHGDTPSKDSPILLAEDDRINQEMLKEMFGAIGLSRVDVVDRGTLVLKRVEEYSYDIIFMDLQMPEMDGLTTTRKLREMGITTPIIALTGMAFQDFHEKCIEAGMNDFLSKPFTLEGLKKILKKFGIL